MHPVLGTMMPEICEAPHLPVFSRHLPLCSRFNGGRRSSHSQWPMFHLTDLLPERGVMLRHGLPARRCRTEAM